LSFRRDIGSPAAALFAQAGLDPDYFENWWLILNTVAAIHLAPAKRRSGWGPFRQEELLQAVAFLKLRHPSLSDHALCSRLLSAKQITGLDLSEGLRRKIAATKSPDALYRQFRFAVLELVSASKAGIPELFAPVSLLKTLRPKKTRRHHRVSK
jgi:hypothetical protein